MRPHDESDGWPGDRGWYPLRLTTTIRPLVYGGHAIVRRLGRTDLPRWSIAESWEVSDEDDAASYVTNGPLRGTSLREIGIRDPESLLGNGWRGSRFPLTARFVDASGSAPPQVEQYAECPASVSVWHVVEASPGATMQCGVREGVEPGDLSGGFEQQDFDTYLRTIPVRSGDTIAIPAGTPYAVGPDTVLYAVAPSGGVQHSPVRWSAEDGSSIGYERWRKNVDDTLRACSLDHRPIAHPGLPAHRDQDLVRTVLHADKSIALERWQIASEAHAVYQPRNGVILTNLGEPVRVRDGTTSTVVDKARTVLLPAALESVQIDGPADFLMTYRPDFQRDIRAPLAAAGFRGTALQALSGRRLELI